MTQNLTPRGPIIRGRGRFTPPAPKPEVVSAREELRTIKQQILNLTKRKMELELLLSKELHAK